MFLDFEGATGHQTLIVSSVSGLSGCFRPSNPYSFKCFWLLTCPGPLNCYSCKCFWTLRVSMAINPYSFKCIWTLRVLQAIKPVSGLWGCCRPSNPYRVKCFWTFGPNRDSGQYLVPTLRQCSYFVLDHGKSRNTWYYKGLVACTTLTVQIHLKL